MAVAIAGGVGGATILALYYIPSAYVLVMCRGRCAQVQLANLDTLRRHADQQDELLVLAPA